MKISSVYLSVCGSCLMHCIRAIRVEKNVFFRCQAIFVFLPHFTAAVEALKARQEEEVSLTLCWLNQVICLKGFFHLNTYDSGLGLTIEIFSFCCLPIEVLMGDRQFFLLSLFVSAHKLPLECCVICLKIESHHQMNFFFTIIFTFLLLFCVNFFLPLCCHFSYPPFQTVSQLINLVPTFSLLFYLFVLILAQGNLRYFAIFPMFFYVITERKKIVLKIKQKTARFTITNTCSGCLF